MASPLPSTTTRTLDSGRSLNLWIGPNIRKAMMATPKKCLVILHMIMSSQSP